MHQGKNHLTLFPSPQLVAAVVVPRLLHALEREVLPLNTAHAHRIALAIEDAGNTFLCIVFDPNVHRLLLIGSTPRSIFSPILSGLFLSQDVPAAMAEVVDAAAKWLKASSACI